MATKKILMTGGAGYVGSHCMVELVKAGYILVVIDNFHNAIRGKDGIPESIRHVSEITGTGIIFREIDLLDESALHNLFEEAVGESVQKPLYYKVNLTGTMKLLEIKYPIVPWREGDIDSSYANPGLAEKERGWKAQFGIDKMCPDLWYWQSQHPYDLSKSEAPKNLNSL